jgi:DNA invertase Pin-like site-specific DNA recombinase
MRVGIYARVSSKRQAQDHTIDQQVASSRSYLQTRGWQLSEEHLYRDDGYSGAQLSRPGLDRLRDAAALSEVDLVVVTAPDRLARKYLHQVLLMEELESHGVQVVFVERPMSEDPHDQLLLQIRGAVAEYERTLITERMRRGKLAKLRAGLLLPWTRGHYGYQVDPERPRDPSRVHVQSVEAVVVQQMVAWYLVVSGGRSNAVFGGQAVGAGGRRNPAWSRVLDGLHRARHPARPNLHGGGLRQSLSLSAGAGAPLSALARGGRQELRAQARGGMDRHLRAPDYLAGGVCPRAGETRP